MIIELPPRNVDQLPGDERKNVEGPIYKPKATFQWPPDCLWPFIDHGSDTDT
jgi:hypothetical protein